MTKKDVMASNSQKSVIPSMVQCPSTKQNSKWQITPKFLKYIAYVCTLFFLSHLKGILYGF